MLDQILTLEQLQEQERVKYQQGSALLEEEKLQLMKYCREAAYNTELKCATRVTYLWVSKHLEMLSPEEAQEMLSLIKD